MTGVERLLVASSNPGKIAEWRALLAPLGVEMLVREGLRLPAEDGATVEENARLKALAAARATGEVALADDVGLEIAAMGGAPGLLLRRWADELGGWGPACQHAATAAPGSAATYRCGVAMAWPDGSVRSSVGVAHGKIVAPRGDGPGLEPCFMPDDSAQVLGDLAPTERNRRHPRSRAFAHLFSALRG